MTWAASVPFPAEDLGKCRGCGQAIGWIQRETDEGGTKPHPVEPRGWHGQECGELYPGCKKGLTLEGRRTAVVEQAPSLFAPTGVVVFESHFNRCPDRARFFGKARAKEANQR